MPRFFFDVDDGQTKAKDQEGCLLPGTSQAKMVAMQAVTDLACKPAIITERRVVSVTVRSEHGAALGIAS